MGCTSSMSRRESIASSLRIIVVGIEDAGKTTILYRLAMDELVDTTPTMGFNVETMCYRTNTVTVWDMGGSPSIRKLWKHYYLNCHGMFFVVDCSARERLQEAEELLNSLLEEKQLLGVPMVVLANKSDLDDSLSVQDIVEYFGLNEITDRLCTIQATSATTGEGLTKALDIIISFHKHIERSTV